MGQTREQKIINNVVGKPTNQKFTPIASEMFLPNHSGVAHHQQTLTAFDARYRLSTGTIDISDDTNLAVTAPIVLTNDTLSLGTVDISANTNLAVTSPIVLTGDTLSFDFSTTNNWTGTNSFTQDVTLTSPAVLKGDRMILMYSHATGAVGIGSTTFYLKAGEVACSATKSPVMPRAGSIISLSVIYDIANAIGGPTPSITFESRINNTAKLTSALSAQSNGTDKETRVTAARGTHTFAAGDNLVASFITTAIKGATMDVTNLIFLIEVVFND